MVNIITVDFLLFVLVIVTTINQSLLRSLLWLMLSLATAFHNSCSSLQSHVTFAICKGHHACRVCSWSWAQCHECFCIFGAHQYWAFTRDSQIMDPLAPTPLLFLCHCCGVWIKMSWCEGIPRIQYYSYAKNQWQTLFCWKNNIYLSQN